VVVGAGNVAVDVTRILAKKPHELTHTEMPETVLQSLAKSTVTDIHLVGRRGPAQASFTTKELRELGELLDADVIVDPKDLELDPASATAVSKNRALARNIDVLRSWSQRPPGKKNRRIHLHFFLRPVELAGQGHVECVRFERTRLDETGECHGTGEIHEIDAQMVVRAIGYRGVPLEGVPFDSRRNVIPNQAGRVLREDTPSAGEYVTGWIKRGPTGIIGTNKIDSNETVATLLADAPMLLKNSQGTRTAVDNLVRAKGLRSLDIRHWHAVDRAESLLGQSYGRERTILHTWDALLSVAQA
jgi:ferredoxin--NADP+ reductase